MGMSGKLILISFIILGNLKLEEVKVCQDTDKKKIAGIEYELETSGVKFKDGAKLKYWTAEKDFDGTKLTKDDIKRQKDNLGKIKVVDGKLNGDKNEFTGEFKVDVSVAGSSSCKAYGGSYDDLLKEMTQLTGSSWSKSPLFWGIVVILLLI